MIQYSYNILQYTDFSITRIPSYNINDIFTYDIKILNLSHYISSIVKNKIVRKNQFNELINGFRESKKTLELSDENINEIIRRFDTAYYKALYEPGTNIGVLASTSISESATQNVLNTFHYSGTTSGQQCSMSVGMPRILELLDLSRDQKSTNLKFKLNIQTENIYDVYKKAYSLEYKVLDDFISNKLYKIYNEDDYKWIEIYKKYICNIDGVLKYNNKKIILEKFAVDCNVYKYVFELNIDTFKLYRYGKSMIEICDLINSTYYDMLGICSPNELQTILIFTIKPTDEIIEEQINLYFDFLYKKIKDLYVCGVYYIEKVFVRPNMNIETNGGILVNVMNTDCVESNTVISNNVWDVYNTLGIEAARQVLVNELNNAFKYSGIVTNEQHIELLADVMATSGILKPVNRYGLDNDSVLSNACFEQSLNILIKAAINSSSDNIKSASSNIICGNAIKSGTGCFDLLLKDI